jgi:hypothetical protein
MSDSFASVRGMPMLGRVLDFIAHHVIYVVIAVGTTIGVAGAAAYQRRKTKREYPDGERHYDVGMPE